MKTELYRRGPLNH